MDEDLRRLVMQMAEDFKKHEAQTERRFDKQESRMDKQEERVDGMDKTQTIQGEQIKGIVKDIKGIEKSLDAIHDDTRFTRRTITGGVITTLITGLGSLVFFSIKLGGG